MTQIFNVISRREVIQTVVLGTVGLAVGCRVRRGSQSGLQAGAEGGGTQIHDILSIDPSGKIKFVMCTPDIGQGSVPAFALLLAEDLEIDPAQMTFEFAGEGTGPFSASGVGGSSGLTGNYSSLRAISATAAALLLKAGADALGSTPSACKLDAGPNGLGRVESGAGKSVSYAEIAQAASRVTPPGDIQPKPLGACRLIGKDIPINLRKVDGVPKVTGAAVFGIDVKLPGMLNAYILRNPFVSGTLSSGTDLSPARGSTGVKAVLELPSSAPIQGICVIAEYFYQALAAARKLRPQWQKGGNINWETVDQQRKAFLDDNTSNGLGLVGTGSLALGEMKEVKAVERPKEPVIDRDTRIAKLAFSAADFPAPSGSGEVAPVDYDVPYVPHAPLEPMNTVAWVHEDGSTEVWSPTQSPGGADKVHQTHIGGGFGRRLATDYIEEALAVAKASKLHVPIKLIWTREDDFRFDYFRPGSLNRLSGKVQNGKISQWAHHMVGSSINHQEYGFTNAPVLSGRADTHGQNPRYDIPDSGLSLRSTGYEPGLRTGFWRAIGHSQNDWLVESFVDELAASIKADPVAFRLANLSNDEMKRALFEVATLANWKGRTSLPQGQGLGVAVTNGWGASVGAIAHVDTNSRLKVIKMWFVLVGGLTVDPPVARQQMQSAMVLGLSAAMKQKITIKDHQIQGTSFGENQPLTLAETPDVEVKFIQTHEQPHGMGETGLPSVAPAVSNAIFAATGKRVRKLPVVLR